MSCAGWVRLGGRAAVVIGAVVSLTGVPVAWLSLAAASARAGSDGLPPCQLSQFAVALGPYVSEATEQHTLALRLVSHGTRTCVLNGYPVLRFDDAAGAIPFVIKHGGDQMIASRPPRPVVVRPGRAAFLVLNKSACVRGVVPGTRATRKITIGSQKGRPSATASITLRTSKIPLPWRVPDYCGRGDHGSIVTVSPFVPTVRAALGG